MKRSRIFVSLVAGVLASSAVAAVVIYSRTQRDEKGDEIPLAVARRGDLNLEVHASGELRASHSMMLTAPAIGGGSLQITQLVHTGELVKKDDIVIEFDPSEQIYKMEQSKSELLQAEQEITKAKDDAVVLTAEDKVALLKAEYGVRQAELDMQKNELVSKIDGQKNQLALDQAQRVLAETKKDIESHQAVGKASIFLAQEKYNKAKLAMDQAQTNLGKMRVIAPLDGLVSIQKNTNAAGGFYFTGMSVPDYHPGDQVQPGGAIAQVVDPMGMDLTCKVGEQERSNVTAGEAVEVEFYAFPTRTFHGTVKSVSGMSTRQFFEANSGGTFDVSIQLLDTDPRLRAGFTAEIVFLGGIKKDVIYIPRQAVFFKDGKRVVYAKKVGGYDQREVKIQSETESRAVISDLQEGTQIALIDPTVPRKAQANGPATAAPGATP
jgi:hypothetical protein